MKVFYLGTAVKITTVLSADLGVSDTVSITIKDSGGSTEVDGGAMARVQNNVWTYTHQTASTDQEGTWTAAISAVSGSNTSVTEIEFEMRKQT